MPSIEFSWESWGEFWPDGEALLREEYEEFKGPLGLTWPFAPATALLSAIPQGIFSIAVARVNGVPKGAFALTFEPDVESSGRIIAKQGFWYVSRDCVKHDLGRKLWAMALAKAKLAKVDVLELHHPPRGRGARLSSFFSSLGAKPMKVSYYLELGEPGSALEPQDSSNA